MGLFWCIVVSNAYCVVFLFSFVLCTLYCVVFLFSFVLCTLCCQFLLIVLFWFPSWYSLTCLWYNINEINTQIMSINDIHVQKCISDFCLLQYKQRKVASYISSCFIMVGFVLLIVLVFWVVLSLSFCFVCLRSVYLTQCSPCLCLILTPPSVLSFVYL